jgi:hypothetical protein
MPLQLGAKMMLKIKRQLLLHTAGPEVQAIFEPFTDTGEDYKTAIDKLNAHFKPLQNVVFCRHLFRQESQKSGESILQFVTRIR